MVPLPMKVELRYAMMESGALYVIVAGITVMQLLSADKWDSNK